MKSCLMDVKNAKYFFHCVVKQLTCFGKCFQIFTVKRSCVIYDKPVLYLRFASLGHEIVGVEGVQTAIEEFFNENKLEYTVRDSNDFKVYEVYI